MYESEEWFKKTDPCGGIEWICIVTYSIYDYIYVNINKNSKYFGSTRYIDIGDYKDEHLTDPPFSNFIDYIQDYILDYYLEEIKNKGKNIEINENIKYFLKSYGSKKYGTRII